MSQKKISGVFAHKKDTENKKQFAEEGEKETQIMGKAYVSKAALEELGNPAKVKITVEAA